MPKFLYSGFTQDSSTGRWRVRCRDGSSKMWTGIVARNVLGRDLKRDEVVHHVDNIPGNDINNNLVICTEKYHLTVLHKLPPEKTGWGRPPRRDKFCKNGHKRSPEDTYVRKNGRRECRVCLTIGKLFRKR